MEQKIKDDLKIADMRKNLLQRLFDEVNAKSSSLLMFTLQWKELDALFSETQKSLQKQADEASLRETRLEETRVSLEKRALEIEKKEKEFADFCTLLRKEHQSTENALTVLRGSIEKFNGELVLKKEELCATQRHLDECCKEAVLKTEELKSTEESLKYTREELQLKERELISVKVRLDECCRELSAKDVNLSLKNQQLCRCREELQLSEVKLCSVKTTLEERLLELESKGKEITKASKDLECKEKELIKLDFCIKESAAELDLQAKQKQTDQNNSPGERRLNLVMAENLAQKILVYDEVIAKLSGSADCAKWVLEQLHSNSWNGYNDSTTMRRTCVLLLEQLMKFSPTINAQVKEDATKLAKEWKSKLGDVPKNFAEVLCFLMLLDAFKLFSAFDKDELLRFVNVLGQVRQVPQLRKGIENAHKSRWSDKPALIKDVKEEKVEDLSQVGRQVVPPEDKLQCRSSNKRSRAKMDG